MSLSKITSELVQIHIPTLQTVSSSTIQVTTSSLQSHPSNEGLVDGKVFVQERELERTARVRKAFPPRPNCFFPFLLLSAATAVT